MIISMKLHATRQEIDEVTDQVKRFGYKVHSIEGEERVVIGVVGIGDVTACLESLEATPGVESAVRISAPCACNASMEQAFTALPFMCTVQAPHCAVSQPTWVPVSCSVSRMNSEATRIDSSTPASVS